MEKKSKKGQMITLDDLKTMILETAKTLGKLTQEDLDAFLTKYDLDDQAAEELLEYITNQKIEIADDSLDNLEDEDIDLAGL